MSTQHRRLILAADITDTMVRERRRIKIGDVTATLKGTFTRPSGAIEVHALVGGAKCWFALEPGTAVEVWRQ